MQPRRWAMITAAAALAAMAVSCDRPVYDEPSGVEVTVRVTAVAVLTDGSIAIDTTVRLPDPPRPGADALERIEISIRGTDGSEYLRAVFNASSVSVNPVVAFGLYPVGEVPDFGFYDAVGDSHDADTLWGAIHPDTREEWSDTDLAIHWVVSLLDVPYGDLEVWAKAVPGRQRDRAWQRIARFTLAPESIEDAGMHRAVLEDALARGVVTIGGADVTVEDLWGAYLALLQQPGEHPAAVSHAGEPSFLRFLALMAEWGVGPGTRPASTLPAVPEVDLASAAVDADPWIAAPAIWMARKHGVGLDEAALVGRLTDWDATAVDQALLYLAATRGEAASLLLADTPEGYVERIWTGYGEECVLDLLLADDPSGDRTIRLQRPTKAGIVVTRDGEGFYGWDGESPIRTDPGHLTISYLLGDPPTRAGPVTADCPAGGSLRVVLWRHGEV